MQQCSGAAAQQAQQLIKGQGQGGRLFVNTLGRLLLGSNYSSAAVKQCISAADQGAKGKASGGCQYPRFVDFGVWFYGCTAVRTMSIIIR